MKKWFFRNLVKCSALVLVLSTSLSCTKTEVNPALTLPATGTAPNPTATNDFFIINEGWYGHETGSVYYGNGVDDTLVTDVYRKVNSDSTLGPITGTLQYATIYNGKMYLVVKAHGPLVVTDAVTMQETARINQQPNNDGRCFLGLNSNLGLLGTSNGIYQLSLSPLAVGTKLTGATGAIGDMTRSGNYIFAASQTSGTVVLNAGTYAVAGTLSGTQMGPLVGKDSSVWVIGGNNLIRINPVTLAKDTIKLSFNAASIWGAWHSTSMAASTQENAIFFEENKVYSGNTRLFKYIVGNTASLTQPFIILPTGQYFYGAGVGYNKQSNELVLTTINGAFTGSINRILIYDAGTGVLKKTYTYNGWYFPAMPVFR